MPSLRTSTKLKLGYVGIAALDTWLAGKHHPMAHRARFLTKPLLMPALAGSLAANPKAADSPLRSTTLVAQAAGWGGDVALLASGTNPFLVGAGSFAVGHAAYLTGFVRHRNHQPLAEPIELRVIAGSWLVSAPALALLARRQQPELAVPVFGYASILAAMVIGAHRLDEGVPVSARRLTMSGATLFMVSDTLLGLRMFALKDPPAGLERAVMATYAAGQLLLSEGAARA